MIYAVFLFISFFKFPAGEAVISISIDTPKDSLTIRIMDYEELKPLLELNNDTTYVINFWATWCIPCVKELPYFIQLDSVYQEEAFKLVLVSLDFKRDYLRKLQPFVKERGLQDQVIVLEDNRSDYWINDIDRTWRGSIPATLVYKGKKRAFFERTFHHVNELSDIVEPFLNQ